MRDWKERLRELYAFENDDTTSPNSIDFNWGSFLFKRKTKEPAPFYIAQCKWIEDFIETLLQEERERVVNEILNDFADFQLYREDNKPHTPSNIMSRTMKIIRERGGITTTGDYNGTGNPPTTVTI